MTISLESIIRPTRDILQASKDLSGAEIRFLVDQYYQFQKQRMGSSNQIRSIDQGADEGPPEHLTLTWLNEQTTMMETQLKRAMDVYVDSLAIGKWLRGVYGIGPVLAAGLCAHIDITKCPTVGHIWRFAGLDPTMVWAKGQKRPHNATLKTLCWNVGQSFMKFSGRPECLYGDLYRKRKEMENERNDAGGNAVKAADILAAKPTHAQRAIYAAGKLPPGQIDARARRYAVKQFLSDMHAIWYREHFEQEPPKPYPIAIMGHAHHRQPFNDGAKWAPHLDHNNAADGAPSHE